MSQDGEGLRQPIVNNRIRTSERKLFDLRPDYMSQVGISSPGSPHVC